MAPLLLGAFGLILAVVTAVLLVMYIVVPTFRGIGWLIRQVFTFIGHEISDVLRVIGGFVTSLVLVPLVIGTIIIGRWSASAHFGRAIQEELMAIGHACYRIVIGNPARLLCLSALTEGIEKRIPDVVARAPGSDRPSKRAGQYDGYTIVGSLPGGGSGARLYVAEPDERKLAGFARMGQADVGQVIIKSFSLHEGSSLPQIVRESRALESAKRMGLVLEHELTDQRFFYVMPYVPGDDLTTVTHRLHEASGPAGLDDRHFAEAMGYVADLVETLDRYHRGGLWHKDVKPDNIIVSAGHAHLVDLGLVTPLRSAMTLTTHGTEYFRDPEMVRMALKGVKVHEVDGAKFDVYAAGAVLFSMIENSFPAHGGLSQVTKRCPEAVRWIIRRAMAEYRSRYASSSEMLADLRAVLAAADPRAVKPAELPSMRGAGASIAAASVDDVPAAQPVAAHEQPRPVFAVRSPAQDAPTSPAAPAPPARMIRPRLVNWWTGSFVLEEEGAGAATLSSARGHVRGTPRPQARPAPARRPSGDAREQLDRARKRVDAARKRAQERMARTRGRRYSNRPNAGVAFAVFLFLTVCVGGAFAIVSVAMERNAAAPAHAHVDVDGLADRVSRNISVRAEEAVARVQRVLAAADARVVSRDAERARVDEGEALRLLAALGDWVLLDTVIVPADLRERADREIEAHRERLHEAGFRLVTKDNGEAGAEALAHVMNVIGVGHPGDAATMQRVRDWVRAQPPSLGGVIWLVFDEETRHVEPHFAERPMI